ncbi:MAG: hypothetical protein R6V07_15285 [Armatimonadota bacterium]
MSEDLRKDDATDEPEEKTDRRSFLKQAGMIGGGALAAMAGFAAAADAQFDIRTGPQGRMGELRLPAIQARNVADVEKYRELFSMAREIPPERWGEDPKLSEAMAEMSPDSRVAGISILQMRQRFKGSPNVGENLVVLFSTLGAGIEALRDSGIDPRAMGNGCGDGCGTGCGTGCMSAAAGGFGCGNGCGNNCNGAEAAGLMCGNGCQATGLEQLSFDREGAALKGVRMKSLNMKTMGAAMQNADRAYNEVFGR